MPAKYLSSGKTITTIVFGVLVLLVFLAFGAVKVSILHIDNFLSPALLRCDILEQGYEIIQMTVTGDSKS